MEKGKYELKDWNINEYTHIVFSYSTRAVLIVNVEGYENDKKLFCITANFEITNRKTKVIITG